MHGNDLPNILAIVSTALTLVVILYARQTVREAKKATTEEQNAVTQLRALLAEERSARAADRRHRQLEQLRAIYRLVLETRGAARKQMAEVEMYKATNSTDWVPPPNWRCDEQNQLGSMIVGAEPELPACRNLVDTSGSGIVNMSTELAEGELQYVFHGLGVESGPVD